jgi:hypothetical protein
LLEKEVGATVGEIAFGGLLFLLLQAAGEGGNIGWHDGYGGKGKAGIVPCAAAKHKADEAV